MASLYLRIASIAFKLACSYRPASLSLTAYSSLDRPSRYLSLDASGIVAPSSSIRLKVFTTWYLLVSMISSSLFVRKSSLFSSNFITDNESITTLFWFFSSVMAVTATMSIGMVTVDTIKTTSMNNASLDEFKQFTVRLSKLNMLKPLFKEHSGTI